MAMVMHIFQIGPSPLWQVSATEREKKLVLPDRFSLERDAMRLAQNFADEWGEFEFSTDAPRARQRTYV